MLRELDAPQRNRLVADIRRTALANRIIAKAAQKAGAPRRRISPAPDHKVVMAFGATPAKNRKS